MAANGATALHCAAARGEMDVARCLLDNGIVARAHDKEGYTAAALAYRLQEIPIAGSCNTLPFCHSDSVTLPVPLHHSESLSISISLELSALALLLPALRIWFSVSVDICLLPSLSGPYSGRLPRPRAESTSSLPHSAVCRDDSAVDWRTIRSIAWDGRTALEYDATTRHLALPLTLTLPLSRCLVNPLHRACCYDEIKGIQDLKMYSHADSPTRSLTLSDTPHSHQHFPLYLFL